ncbi:MAG: FISUMP domain-containing protein [Bacteroidales bacterium]
MKIHSCTDPYVMKFLLWGAMILSVLFSFEMCSTEEKITRSCIIIEPTDSSLFYQGDTVQIIVGPSSTDEYLRDVRFDIDGRGVYSTEKGPYRYNWITLGQTPGKHIISASSLFDDGISASSAITIYLSAGGDTGLVSDADGRSYRTVKIGNQWWMAENLNSRVFPDKTEIPLITDPAYADSAQYISLAMCYPEFNADSMGIIYGALYTWEAATNGQGKETIVQGVCPTGWHLPSDAEWKILEMNIGMDPYQVNASGFRGTDEGAKLREQGSVHWECSNLEATNAYGFNALPASYHSFLHITAQFWTSTGDPQGVWIRQLVCDRTGIRRVTRDANSFLSVRCVKDKSQPALHTTE